MKLPYSFRNPAQSGYTLITTLMLTATATILLGATLGRTLTGSKLNDRNNAYMVGNAAAEAAVEKVLARMMVDFSTGGEQMLSNNMNTYRTAMVPATTENPFWSNFVFFDGQGNSNRTFVQRTTTNANPPFVNLLEQYPGLSAFASSYRVVSDVTPASGGYRFTNAVQQDVQMAEIPVFQFAIFYNGLLEFTDCAPLSVNGRVHCNTNIYVGCLSSSSLTFNYFVTCSGIITNPPWDGFLQSSWTGPVTYNGTPTPGWGTGQPVLTLPIGTNNTAAAVREIINPPPLGESTTNPVSAQRFFNKAFMLVQVYDTNAVVTLKNSLYDIAPIVINSGTTNWTNANIAYFLSTNVTFFDQREGRSNRTTQIDISHYGTWIATNAYCLTKWPATNTAFNGVLYVQDNRTTNGSWMDAVRVVNGANITNGLYTLGLTVASPNPIYVLGNYNCPNPAFLGTTNTTVSRPCSFVCDALTVLSPNWQSLNYDASSTGSYASRAAASDTVNAAIIAGNVPSTGSSDTQFSGGVHNLPRLLEDWSGKTLTLNTSMINLYNSVQAGQQFQMPGIYYKPPSRNFWFDQNFNTSTGLPPGTPMIDRMIRATWCNPPPNDVTYAPSPTLDFVPR